MTDSSQIREHMEVIGADGVHVGTVDCIEGDRIVPFADRTAAGDALAQDHTVEGGDRGTGRRGGCPVHPRRVARAADGDRPCPGWSGDGTR